MKQQVFSRDFTLVVIGQIISLFGNAILHFALPLYLLRETGSSALFGVVTACSFLPMVILSPVGGAVADRVNKRSMMAGLDFFTAGLILMYTLIWGLAPLVPVTVACLMLLYGIAGAYQPSVQASVPLLLPHPRKFCHCMCAKDLYNKIILPEREPHRQNRERSLSP